MRLLGVIFLVLGVVVLTAGLIIGLPFTGIYLMGFIGTGGREAGRELLMFLPTTLLVCGAGYGLLRLGKRLRSSTA